MIKAVQNNNACELLKANDKNDDLTLNHRANSTATNSAATATFTVAATTAAAAAATNDDEDDCVYVSPDEAENGIN